MASQDFLEDLDEDLRAVGISLESIEVNGTAWRRDDALRVLSALRHTDWAVLGGDVLELADERLAYTYDNWSCSSTEGETKKDFLRRSHDEARRYLGRFAEDPRLYFVLVCARVF